MNFSNRQQLIEKLQNSKGLTAFNQLCAAHDARSQVETLTLIETEADRSNLDKILREIDDIIKLMESKKEKHQINDYLLECIAARVPKS